MFLGGCRVLMGWTFPARPDIAANHYQEINCKNQIPRTKFQHRVLRFGISFLEFPRRFCMATDIRLKEALPEITEALVGTYSECSRINHLGHKPLPSREAIVEIIADLLDILYPGYGRRQNLHIGNVEFHVGDVVDGLHDKLTQQIARALRHEDDQEK